MKNMEQKSHLNKDKKIPFNCNFCGKEFNYVSELQQHQRIHTKEKPFKCGICQRGFSHKGSVNRHQLIHKRETPFNCGICQISFTRKTHLQRHQKFHKREKRFKCDICQRIFRYEGYLKRHQKEHEIEMTCKNEKCQKSYTTQDKLKTHMQINMKVENCSSANIKLPIKTHTSVEEKCKNDSGTSANEGKATSLTSKKGNTELTFQGHMQTKKNSDSSKKNSKSIEQIISFLKEKNKTIFATELNTKSNSEMKTVTNIQTNETSMEGSK